MAQHACVGRRCAFEANPNPNPNPNPRCAFEVLLGESGGCMRDVLGNEIDLVRAMRRGSHTGGVLVRYLVITPS